MWYLCGYYAISYIVLITPQAWLQLARCAAALTTKANNTSQVCECIGVYVCVRRPDDGKKVWYHI